jgi:hypothetical protein
MYLQPNMQNRVEQWKAQCLSKGNRSVLFGEGDSWFDYPFLEDRYPLPSPSNYDLLRHVSNHFVLTAMAHHGDEIGRMVTGEQKARNVQYVKKVQSMGGRFKAALISGGGNDIVGDNGRNFRQLLKQGDAEDPDSWLRPEDADGIPGYASRLDAIVRGYEAYFDFVKNYLGDIPIIGHIYAYPFPNGKSYRGMGMLDMAGPWFKPHLDAMQVPDALRRPILKSLIDGFAERLLELESRTPRFHVVDFRGKLDDEGFWQNEMHPNDEGFGLLGEEFVNVIESWTVG